MEDGQGRLRFEMLGEVHRFPRALKTAVGFQFLVKIVKMKRRFGERTRCGRGGCCIRQCPR